MLNEIGTVDNIPEFIEGVKNRSVLVSNFALDMLQQNCLTTVNLMVMVFHAWNRKRKMSGFGHRVYKNYDPRAKVIKKLAEEVFLIVGRDPLIEVFKTS